MFLNSIQVITRVKIFRELILNVVRLVETEKEI